MPVDGYLQTPLGSGLDQPVDSFLDSLLNVVHDPTPPWSSPSPAALRTRNVRCVTPAPSTTWVLSSSMGVVPRCSNNRTPPPSKAGTRSTCISSRRPNLMHSCTMLAAPTATSFSPATALACSMALSTPSVTKVNGDPS